MNFKELIELGYLPPKGWKSVHSFPVGFKLPETVERRVWKYLPLNVQILYEYNNEEVKKLKYQVK